MIRLESLSLQKGSKVLLDHTDLRLHAGWTVGLIGENGSGKSSFFELIQNNNLADTGRCDIPSDWRIAHLRQEIAAENTSAIDYVIDGHQAYRQTQADLLVAENDNDMHRLASLHAKMDEMRAYEIDSIASSMLSGLGFSNEQQQQHVNQFSGGWRIRLNLAQTLMMPSELLLLDEPTNHLDLDSILWLEKFLSQYKGTMIIVSHDREFLDNTVQHIVHIHQKNLSYFNGNYSQFELQLAEQSAQQDAQFKKQQKQIEHMEDFIRRFKAKATKAKQAQSRVKALERMELILPAHKQSPFSFRFFQQDNLPNSLIRLDNADLGYPSQGNGDSTILSQVNLELNPESRIGIIGLNGSGKSTLLKSLIGDLPCLQGDFFQNERCRTGYFSQHQLETLDLRASPLVHLTRLSAQAPEQEIRKFLGSFGFHGDEVNEEIEHFSGGEKSRLALAIICWQKPNLLILDEPTNHLDIEMRHALNLALQEFNGALIVVSHDRHLIRCTTDQLYLIDQGRCEVFSGDVDNYAQQLTSEKPSTYSGETKSTSTGDKKNQKKLEAGIRAKVSPLRKQLKSLEKKLDLNHKEELALQDTLSDSSLYDDENKAQLKELLLKQSQLKANTEILEEEWMRLSEEIDAVLQNEE